MSTLEKLLAVAAFGRKAYDKWLLQRLVSRGLMVVGIVFVIAILVSALLIGLLFVAHGYLVQGGLDPSIALLIIGLIISLIIALLINLVANYVRGLPRLIAKQSSIGTALDAFLNGLLDKKPSSKRTKK